MKLIGIFLHAVSLIGISVGYSEGRGRLGTMEILSP